MFLIIHLGIQLTYHIINRIMRVLLTLKVIGNTSLYGIVL